MIAASVVVISRSLGRLFGSRVPEANRRLTDRSHWCRGSGWRCNNIIDALEVLLLDDRTLAGERLIQLAIHSTLLQRIEAAWLTGVDGGHERPTEALVKLTIPLTVSRHTKGTEQSQTSCDAWITRESESGETGKKTGYRHLLPLRSRFAGISPLVDVSKDDGRERRAHPREGSSETGKSTRSVTAAVDDRWWGGGHDSIRNLSTIDDPLSGRELSRQNGILRKLRGVAIGDRLVYEEADTSSGDPGGSVVARRDSVVSRRLMPPRNACLLVCAIPWLPDHGAASGTGDRDQNEGNETDDVHDVAS